MLTRGSIQQMVLNNQNISPWVQSLDIKKIVSQDQGTRFRLILSDGDFYMQGMMSSQMQGLCESDQISKFTIIHIKEYVINVIKNIKICIIIKADVIAQHPCGIGRPRNAMTAVC